jgi:hypothetical protein
VRVSPTLLFISSYLAFVVRPAGRTRANHHGISTFKSGPYQQPIEELAHGGPQPVDQSLLVTLCSRHEKFVPMIAPAQSPVKAGVKDSVS